MRRRIQIFLSCVLCMLICMLSIGLAQAQIKVSGTISSAEDKDVIPGAAVIIEGTTIGSAAGINGRYELEIPQDRVSPTLTLVFSSIGYKEKKVVVGSERTINVELKFFFEQLDEVVVTAYGQQERRSLTGSISAISSKDLENQQVVAISRALQGTVPGVQVISSSGQPGALPSIYVRGYNSLSSSTQPLQVLDGAPLSLGLYSITQEDIASITVLKDGSAAVLYGARGANGVIVYTTKTSTRGKVPQVNFNIQTGVSSRAVGEYEVPRASEYMRYSWEGLRNDEVDALLNQRNVLAQLGLDPTKTWELVDLSPENQEIVLNLAGESAEGELLRSLSYNPYGTVRINQLGKVIPTSPIDEDGDVVHIDKNGFVLKKMRDDDDEVVKDGNGNILYVNSDDESVSDHRPASLKWDTDWEDISTNELPINTRVHLNMQGGKSLFRYYVSGTYLDQDGYVLESKFQRFGGRLNVETDPTKYMTIGTYSAYAYRFSNTPTQSGSQFRNSVQAARNLSNIHTVYQRDARGDIITDENGVWKYDTGAPRGDAAINHDRRTLQPLNILVVTRRNYSETESLVTYLTPFMEFRFSKDLSFRSTLAYFNVHSAFHGFDNPEFGDGVAVGGRVTTQRNSFTELTWNNKINYHNTFNKIHEIDITALGEIYDYRQEIQNIRRTRITGEELDGAGQNEDSGGSSGDEHIARLMGLARYGLFNRYFLELGISRDGQSRFEEGQRWSTFLSTGVGWLISDELFFPKGGAVNTLRLRATYGILGNSSSGGDLFPAVSRLGVGTNNVGQPGVFRSNLYDNNIQWEKSDVINIGLETSLFKDRIKTVVEGYLKRTKELIFNRPLPASVGYTEFLTNISAIENKGLEVSINSLNVRSRDFQWRTNLIVNLQKNEITSMPDDVSARGLANGTKRWLIGKSRYEFFLPEWAGVDPDTGRPMWWKTIPPEGEKAVEYEQLVINGQQETGLPTSRNRRVKTFNYDSASLLESRVFVGRSIPWAYGGLGNTFTYKGITLGIQFSYSLGGKYYDGDYQSLSHNGMNVSSQLSADLENRWQSPGDITDTPRLSSNDRGNRASTRFLYDNSYARLNSVYLGYSVPKKWLRPTQHIRNITLFGQAQNMLTLYLSKNRPPQGADPESSVAGVSNQRSTVFKTYTMGLSVGF